jgi:2-polyprenyl-3-methyl-5-hydroxy-6-metoxy-1,4-benzoquinol methylase
VNVSRSLTKEKYEINKRLLLSNKGFEHSLDDWIPLVDTCNINQIPSEWRLNCPYCGCEKNRVVGQYLYYSNLPRLRSCLNCSLVYSDILIDESVLLEHFEIAYKDEEYFLSERMEIFREICQEVVQNAPPSARVLDVGGATAVLAEMIQEKRPDLEITISDISGVACNIARQKGFQVIHGGISDTDLNKRYEVILLIDVLYYERNLPEAIERISQILTEEGCMVYRGPNKMPFVILGGFIGRIFPAFGKIPFFNPEHLYILHPSFLRQVFRSRGFSSIDIRPSRSLIKQGKIKSMFASFVSSVSWIFFCFSGKVVSPSFTMVIKR